MSKAMYISLKHIIQRAKINPTPQPHNLNLNYSFLYIPTKQYIPNSHSQLR